MKIVVLDGYTLNPGDISWGNLDAIGELKVYDRTPRDQILERVEDAQIILTNKTPLRSDVIDKLPILRYIGVLATGYDVVDVKAANEKGIVVTNIPAYGTTSVAQFVFALLLELCHHVGLHSEAVRKGEWANSKDWSFWREPLVELSGKTMGIIGAGQIGMQTAQIATAFGMHVVAYNRSTKNTDLNIRWVNLEQLMTTADVISLHCPLTPQTEGIINKGNLAKMKNTSFLINTSRGKLVRDEELAEALNQNVIAGAGLDVLSLEPPSLENPLLQASNCIITPHIAWASKEARSRLLNTAVDNIQSFISGSVINSVN